MSDDLLRYYNTELEYLRRIGAEFARTHPRTAGYLNFGDDEEYDPHVGRLVQAFAYLNARTRKKLDDDFPELSESMLDILYPHYLRPIPSMAIVQFALDRSQSDMTAGYEIPRGTRLESEPSGGQTCRFRTCYDVTCWPFVVAAARYDGVPFTAPATRFSQRAQSLLSIRLDTLAKELTFAGMEVPRVRFFLRSQAYFGHLLYELLMNHVLGIAVSTKPEGPAKAIDRQRLLPVGFREEEGLIDYPARSFLGYRLLTEFFCFPDKFLFFDVELSGELACKESSQTLYIYLDRYIEELQPHVTAATFATGCTPIVNLYRQRAEPIRLTHFEAEHRLIPDARRPFAHEVYSIDRVVGLDPSRKQFEFHPFYSIHHESGNDVRRYWQGTRHWNGGADPVRQGGNEVQLSFVDLDFSPAEPAEMTIDVDTTCLNRNLPNFLPFGGDRPKFEFEEGSAVRKIACLTKPTATLRPALGQTTRWQLVSHLALGHLSLTGSKGLEALREILRLYNFKESPETQKLISGVAKIETHPTLGRIGGPATSGICRGVEVAVSFDPEQYKEGGMFLLASVLDRFFALYCNINSFTQTVAKTTKREGILKRWPPRAGEQTLL